MSLVDRIRTAAIVSAALITCTPSSSGPEPRMLPQELRQETPRETPLRQETTESIRQRSGTKQQRIEGAMLDYAVRRSFYHRGHFSYDFTDLLSQTPVARHHDSSAEFFIAKDNTCYVGVIHLANVHHEMDIFIGDFNAFPDRSPGTCRNIVDYREAGGRWIHLYPQRIGDDIRIRGAPMHVDNDTALLMFARFLVLYTTAIQELAVEERIRADYYSHHSHQRDK